MTTATKVRMPRITLPISFDTGAVKFVVRHYKDEHFDEIFKMFQNSLTDSTGLYTIIYVQKRIQDISPGSVHIELLTIALVLVMHTHS